jgi:hypothetical protein
MGDVASWMARFWTQDSCFEMRSSSGAKCGVHFWGCFWAALVYGLQSGRRDKHQSPFEGAPFGWPGCLGSG